MLEARANPYQHRFFLEWQLAPDSTLYNTPLVYRIAGELDLPALRTALGHFVNHYYSACLGRFELRGEALWQLPGQPLDDVLAVREVASDQDLDAAIDQVLAHAFDLQAGPLFRFDLLRQGGQQRLVLNFHHIIADATSALQFVQVLAASYQCQREGHPLPLPEPLAKPLAVSASDAADVGHWCARLAGRALNVELPCQRDAQGAAHGLGASHYFDLDDTLARNVRRYARSQGATPFVVLAAALAEVLRGYSGARSLVLNYPVDERPAGTRRVLGCHINNYPLPVEINPGDSLQSLVAALREERKAARGHSRFTLTEVMRHLRAQGLSVERPFNVSLVEAYFGDDQLALGAATLTPHGLGRRQVVGDLVVAYQVEAQRIRLRLDYPLERFSPAFIERLGASLAHLLEHALAEPEAPLDARWLLPPAMAKQLRGFTGEPGSRALGQDGVMRRFLDQVQRQPEAPALQYRQATLGYRQLASAASALAERLGECPAAACIGVHLRRKDQAVIAMLAVLGKGAAYVPIDPDMPLERLRDIVADSAMDLLITDQALPIDVRQLCHSPLPARATPHPVTLQAPTAGQLAYLIYTSGSTGKPKGVRITHGALGNLVADFVADLGLNTQDRVLGATAVGFDIFGLELFGALTCGACLQLIDEQLREPATLACTLDELRPTLLQGTPSFWSLLALAGWRPAEPERVRLLCGGEALSANLASYLLGCASQVVQVYGPTETTIWSTRQHLSDAGQHALIGRPVGATRCYVLDEQGQALPWGASGELYIGGAGLAEGYHRRAALNAERFPLLDPLGLEGQPARLYRTGDRVCWDDHGRLVYHGRLDFQVKVRGHRIELGEVEHALHQLPGIRQAVVLAWDSDGQTELSAHVVPRDAGQGDPATWRAALLERLPAYMVPQRFECLARLPRSLNGKVDRQALKRPPRSDLVAQVAPQGPTQLRLAAIWQTLLELPQVGAEQSFFELGGHSLLAAQLLVSIDQQFGVRLSLADLLRQPSVAELAAHLDAAGQRAVPAEPRSVAARLPLCAAQRQLYFSDRYDEGGPQRFNLAVVQRLDGPLDVDALQWAWQQVAARHRQLHMRIEADAEGLWQVYDAVAEPALTPIEVAPAQLPELLRRALRTPLPLDRAPLYRLRLLRLNAQQHVLLLQLPHLLADGWSFELLREQLSQAYNARRRGQPLAAVAVKQHYADALAEQQAWLDGTDGQQAVAFWRELLAGYEGLDLPRDSGLEQAGDEDGGHCHFDLPATLIERLEQHCTARGTSLFCALYAAYAVLLGRYCNTRDLVISVPSANRGAGNDQVLGLFTSTLPLRLHLDDHAGFGQLLAQVTQLARQAQTCQGVPLEAMGEVAGDGRVHPWMQAVFTLQNANEQHTLALDDVQARFVEVHDGIARYPLFLSLRRHDGALRATLEYDRGRFAAARMARLGEHYQYLLEQLLEADVPLRDLQLLRAEQRQALLQPVRMLASTPGISLVEAFAEVAGRMPGRVALEDGRQRLSYAELDRASDHLARRLRRRHRQLHGQALAADTLVGLCADRGIELLVGMLGILKAGAAYVPLDPDYPHARLAAVCQDSALTLLVAQGAALERSGLRDMAVVLLDGADDDGDAHDEQPLPRIAPTQLAYVIHTSGSTGTPKGAMLSHHNVMRLFTTSRALFDFDEHDSWCLFHSYAFDFSVWEIWGALLHGARLVIVPQPTSRDPEALRALLLEHGVTVLNQTPSAFVRLLAEDLRHPGHLPLRQVIFGGEALQAGALAPWFGKYGKRVRLSNMYGITETTVHVTHTVVRHDDLGGNRIGRPLPDLAVLVLDAHGQLCPPGVTGELHVAGAGLARGYLNQPALTAHAFVERHGLRLYRSGDLGRWLEDGTLEYQGRNDHQVKVRGFRIELGDIQAALLRLAQIDDAVVRHDASRGVLQAWFSASRPVPLASVQSHLRDHLPAHMQPQQLRQVERLPLTANGKVDIAALRALAPLAAERAEAGRAPAGERETLLADIWRKVLELPQVAADDDFFACGGDSLRILDVQRLVRAAGFTFSPRQLYRHPTLAALAVELAPWQARASAACAPFALLDPERAALARQAGDQDGYPLTALQEGMLFHSQLEQAATYLDIMSCRVRGPFDEAALREELQALMRDHAVLRTLFAASAQGHWQRVRAALPLPLQVEDLRALEPAAQERWLEAFHRDELQRPLNGDQAPLWRATAHVLHGGWYLTLTCHHAILDGWSVARLFTTVLENLDRRLQGEGTQASAAALDFSAYVARERHWRAQAELGAFWQTTCDSLEPTLLAEAPRHAEGHLRRLEVPLDGALDAALRDTARGLGVSLDLVLLAAHLQALSRFTGRRQVACGMPSHGRLVEDEGQRMLGLFLNTTPCVVTLSADEPPRQLVQRLRDYRAGLGDAAQYPLREILRERGGGALFDSLFNFVHFHVFDRLQHLRHLQVSPGHCHEQTNFTLVNQTGIDPHSGALRIELVHRCEQWCDASAQRFALYLRQALCDLAEVAPDRALRTALQALYPPVAWQGRADQAAAGGMLLRFAEIVARHGQRLALRGTDQALSYAELDRWSDNLALALQASHGASLAGQHVGVFTGPGMATIATLLAVLKAGASYLPLDPGYPTARLRQLLDDARPALLAGAVMALERHAELNLPARVIDDAPLLQMPARALPPADANALAYVMYTSGSSGQPKGVMVEQAGILRLVVEADYVRIGPGDVLGQLATLSFDAATFELWGALLNGATLALAPVGCALDSPALARYLREQAVSVLFITTRLFDRHVAAGHAAMFRGLRYLMIGGEVMDPVTVDQLLACAEGCPQQVYNVYGPTENTTFSTFQPLDREYLAREGSDIAIGRPIRGTSAHVLDERGLPAAIGQVGELYLGGPGLARGYLNDPARSAAAFITLDPADGLGRRRLYRTGDAVRWQTDGSLGYRGRIDRTVKINGYRVNLGELENSARQCAGVDQCIAVGGQGLLLYFSGTTDAQALRQALASQLPGYMLPARLIAVDTFELNRNGKIDSTRLPAPDTLSAPPRSFSDPSEQRLHQIWSALLGHGEIDAEDNFFERGGDSLLAMQLQQHISLAFARELTVVEVFRHPTLRSMARFLDGAASQAQPDNDEQRRAAAFSARRARLTT
ncbi:amino acid adenylation domain-containing protein [Pseudomonas sp. B21-023]|uniref:non-ribosomal peptide synthetase n=1 Tax=Pseudomonas sp. B21-023 TaxID=2895477 RepID=UPI00215EC2BC|nr:non-ribosomal peptide synthetase [Pseudomonas sp. B21-023]UVM14765.1 amino acid adenylation domain-containing protein [Pseudomonas sp. B21-023]